MLDKSAHSDRIVLVPTAYTHPAGTFYFSSYDIVFLQAGYAATDRTQLTLTGTPPIIEGGAALLDFSLKSAVYRAPRVQIAALGSASGVLGVDDVSGFVGRAGGIVELCTTSTCDTTFVTSAHVALLGPATIMATANGFIWHLGDWFEILLEVSIAMPFNELTGEYHGALLGTGVRLPRRSWALDFAWARPLTTGGSAIPVFAFTWRTDP